MISKLCLLGFVSFFTYSMSGNCKANSFIRAVACRPNTGHDVQCSIETLASLVPALPVVLVLTTFSFSLFSSSGSSSFLAAGFRPRRLTSVASLTGSSFFSGSAATNRNFEICDYWRTLKYFILMMVSMVINRVLYFSFYYFILRMVGVRDLNNIN